MSTMTCWGVVEIRENVPERQIDLFYTKKEAKMLKDSLDKRKGDPFTFYKVKPVTCMG